jgi:Sensors of blue-light using FAD
MIEVVYASAGSQPFSSSQLIDLLAKARTNNQALGVTGLLLYHGGSFLQVLEGEDSVVSSLFEKIAKDPRHNRCIVIKRSTVTERSFADWSMGFAEVSPAVATRLDGFNSFLLQGRLDLKRSAKQLEQILGGFRSGRWRQHIS